MIRTKTASAENGACEGKFELAKLAKKLNLDAIHDTLRESHGTRRVTARRSGGGRMDILSKRKTKKQAERLAFLLLETR